MLSTISEKNWLNKVTITMVMKLCIQVYLELR